MVNVQPHGRPSDQQKLLGPQNMSQLWQEARHWTQVPKVGVCIPSSGTKQDFAAGGGLPAWAATTGQLFTHKQAPSPNTSHESGLTAIWNSHKPLSYLQTARVWPECLHSPSFTLQQQQVHVKGQIYIKIVLKPLGKVGVKEKKVAGQHK